MMEQLGIKKLRPGPSGRTGATNAANYDPAKANPYPDLPEVLTLKNGQKVTTAEMWWKQRRPEIVEDFEREVVGRVPKNVPKVTWTVVTQATDRVVGGIPVVAKQLVGHVDNSACPSITVDIQMTLVTPAECQRPRAGADDVWRWLRRRRVSATTGRASAHESLWPADSAAQATRILLPPNN